MNELSDVSQDIARYLVQYGHNPFTEDGGQNKGNLGHYEIKKQLPDGRTLRAYFCDVGKKGVHNPSPESRLEVMLKPAADDQFGYSTGEYGLTGEWDALRILTGTQKEMLEGWFHFSRDKVSESTLAHIQEKYTHMMKQVYRALPEE